MKHPWKHWDRSFSFNRCFWNGSVFLRWIKNREPNGALIASLGFSTKNISQTLLIVKTVESPDLASEWSQRPLLSIRNPVPAKIYQGGETDFQDFRKKAETGPRNTKDGWSTIAKLRWLVLHRLDIFPSKTWINPNLQWTRTRIPSSTGRLHQMRFQKNYVYVDDDVFGFTINAADYLKRRSRRGVS